MELAHLVNPSDWEVNGNCSVAILPIYLYLVSVESGLVCCHLMIQYTCVVKIVKKNNTHYCNTFLFCQCTTFAGTPGLDEPQSSSNTVLVAGVAVSVVVLVLAAVCIVVMVIWWR